MASYSTADMHRPSQPVSARAALLVNVAGAAVSLGLIVGVGVWGYKLVMRDVTGIPVVRAMEGEMRVAPENPGGAVAMHTGLAVNTVAAEGEAAGFGDTLVLAPPTGGLASEDLTAQPLAEEGEVEPQPADAVTAALAEAVTHTALTDADEEPAAPLTADQILALADQIAAGATPLSDLPEGTPAPEVTAEVVTEPEAEGETGATFEIIPASVPGPAVSLRPVLRPAALSAGPVAAAAPVTPTEVAVTTAPLPVGTKLVQLGAYPSPDVAAAEWTRLSGRFAEFMAGKDRVIQTATSGGKTFYRLRAQGFEDLADARRFCAALDAGGAPCIPVVVR